MKPSDLIGRFELRKQLGAGAQSTVWLAFDPRMQRDVAIKILRSTEGSDEQTVSQWLQEARSVGRVKHPSIVPVYEADIHERTAFLVFEYVQGSTLSERLKAQGALPAREAVALMMDVLDAVAVAHAEGVVHRDIKPSNILLDAAGRARVMDFGIAASIKAGTSPQGSELGGTVGYLAPEAIKGAKVAPSMDIFACGVVLAELLTGKPLIADKDTHRALYRTAHEQLHLGAEVSAGVDDQLRSIVNRALALNPEQRFSNARAFFAELDQWRNPPAANQDAPAGGSSSTLEFLLRRMRHKSDFPALSESVVRIQNMAVSDTESVGSVTNEILKDVALTNKLLRVVNSAHYARGGNISTVSRAVNLVGFNGIRNMALSLVLLEHMQDKAHASQLKEEFLRSLMAGSIGAELCPGHREAEEAFLGSMFQNLGRLLVQFYFPEEASQIRALTQAPRDALSESAASMRVLGLSFENLGIGVAKSWGLPDNMQRCMRHPTGSPPSTASPHLHERVRWVAMAANEIADLLLHADPKDAPARIQAVSQKYAQAIGLNAKEMRAATDTARQKLVDMAQAMEIRVTPGSAASRLLNLTDSSAHTPATGGLNDRGSDSLGTFELHATQTVNAADAAHLAPKSTLVAETLSAGIQDITNAMVEDFKLTDVLRMILETMLRALQFDRIIFCMRDAKTETMVGRFGLGQGVESHVKVFKSHLKAATPDLFGVVCIKGVDSLISDAAESRIKQRLPDWYFKSLNAPTFLLLPLHIKGAPFGLIYADKTEKDSLELDEKELALLRTLRNQAVMAFKQSS